MLANCLTAAFLAFDQLPGRGRFDTAARGAERFAPHVPARVEVQCRFAPSRLGQYGNRIVQPRRGRLSTSADWAPSDSPRGIAFLACLLRGPMKGIGPYEAAQAI